MKANLTILMLLITLLSISSIYADDVTIGNGTSMAYVPFNNSGWSSLFECIYYPSEHRLIPGSVVTGVRFYVENSQYAENYLNHQTQIWLGTTTQNTLTNWILPTALTEVFSGPVNLSVGQPLTFTFTTPYTYNGGNLVIYIYRPQQSPNMMGGNKFRSQTGETTRAKEAEVVGMNPGNLLPNQPPPVVSSAVYPRTTFLYTHPIVDNDLDCYELTGETLPNVNVPTVYSVTVKNKGTLAQTSYQVKLYNSFDDEISSANGPVIAPGAAMSVNVPWTPASVGNEQIYAKVIMANDPYNINNTTHNRLNIVVMPQSTNHYTVGQGGQLGKIPVDVNGGHSLSETVFPAAEFTYPGTIHGIRLYNNFLANAMQQVIYVWMGESAQQNLGNAWIPSTALNLVYSGFIDFPMGQNNIDIIFDTPYQYSGGNLVMMMHRPLGASGTGMSSPDNFITQTTGINRTRNVAGWSEMDLSDPANPPQNSNITGMFAKTTFLISTAGLSSLSGNVSSGGTPMSGVQIRIGTSNLTTLTDTNGNYNFPFIPAGLQTVFASLHGYYTVSQNVTMVEDQAAVLNFNLTPLALVSVSGLVMGSDNSTTGLSGAIVHLTGYQEYTGTTNASGNFTIPAVFVGQTYDYVISHTGYNSANGQVTVNTTNVNLGTITLNETAYPVLNVVATQAADENSVSIAWNAPNRALVGYRVWRMLSSQSGDEAAWTALTPNNIVNLSFVDNSWIGLPNGVYKYAVRAIYTNNVTSNPVFSNEVSKAISGILTGLVSDFATDTPLEGAIISAGIYSCTTNAQGNYSLSVYAASYDVSCVKEGYQTHLANNVNIPGGQTTTLNFELTENLVPVSVVTAVVANPNVTLSWASPTRVLLGYKVWRLLEGQQNNEEMWVSLTPEPITEVGYTDINWAGLPNGTYLWAIKALYTGGLQSAATFSNTLVKIAELGTIGGTVRTLVGNLPLAGAVVTCGAGSATTNVNGTYFLNIGIGTYTVTASYPNYGSQTTENVIVQTGQVTQVNFWLDVVSADDNNNAPLQTSILGANPNPFHNGESTIVSVGLKGGDQGTLSVYNLLGQKIRSFSLNEGINQISWNGSDTKGRLCGSGVYLLKLNTKTIKQTHKISIQN
jgi:hypothetical protein